MSRQFTVVYLALFAACTLATLFVHSEQTLRLTDRYHARNRTSNFFARSADKPEKANSGATVVGKKLVATQLDERRQKFSRR